jgi:ketosteroid isomerase-like protein
MSQENVEIARGVRTPVTVSTETRPRRLDERILVRFPALLRPLGLVWSRLPPRSRLRRAMNARLMRQAQEAGIRRDFELLFLRFDPEIEFEMAENPAFGFVAPDVVGVHRGRESYLRVFQLVTEAWEDLKFEPNEVIDFGDQLLTAGRITGHARHTGIALDTPLFQLFTVRRGLVLRQRDFVDRDRALEAAGLSE